MKITTDSSTIAKIQEQMAKIEPSISEEYKLICEKAKNKSSLIQRFHGSFFVGHNFLIKTVMPEKFERATELSQKLQFIRHILSMTRFDEMNIEENLFISLNESETKSIFKAAETFNFKVKTYLSEQNTPINTIVTA